MGCGLFALMNELSALQQWQGYTLSLSHQVEVLVECWRFLRTGTCEIGNLWAAVGRVPWPIANIRRKTDKAQPFSSSSSWVCVCRVSGEEEEVVNQPFERFRVCVKFCHPVCLALCKPYLPLNPVQNRVNYYPCYFLALFWLCLLWLITPDAQCMVISWC